ncbi:hypothetical protein LX15_003578 [Streptoalloteichus tenebrarius]|uniref:Uncharacterized protein n=1 Tax=Streptoalloteichus tenebrarius (strain ATCC 17920 / DSM 40477 / JCM 4838 / CBS 697.72 / NBRC 16177 / NCIMB 11028 / NRRL B-12390 / A12253. 1 / ISP 5477) TaxID=1933 RepID=A0ABT1HWI3_STRSD|nr:SCO6880 family protein [Streptoalloteichus tenebrarius]MCP2259869.1 hypothetical protein [Streptoalloteichus tenebrarius]
MRRGTPAPCAVLVVRPSRPSLVAAEQLLARREPWVHAGLVVPVQPLVVSGARRWPRGVVGAAGRRVSALLTSARLLPHHPGSALGGICPQITPFSATSAGSGTDGRAHALYRALDRVEDQLCGVGCTSVEWLDSPGLAVAVRSRFNPHATGERPCSAAAGPTTAPPPAVRSYTHDGFTSVTYAVLVLESGVLFGSLRSLLIPRTVGERRALAVHYEILPPHLAWRGVRVERKRHALIRDTKTRRGFTVSAADQRAVREAYGGRWGDHAARLENAATGWFRLLRLELAQDSAFVAACVPIGLGLPKLRWKRMRK